MAVAIAGYGLAGCSLDTSGAGSGSPIGPGEGDADGDGTQGHGSVGGTEPGEGEGGATSGVDDTGDGPPVDSGPDHPAVTISDGPRFDFGTLVLNSPLDHAFTISNDGTADATAVQLGGLAGAFTVESHGFGDTLPAGESCVAQVRFAPNQFGDHMSELVLSFEDAGVPASASRPLTGRGVGTTGDLVVNGGGEEGGSFQSPPVGWTSSDFNWAVSEAVDPHEGDRTLHAGLAITVANPTVLVQQIDVAQLTQWGDAAGVTFHFRAHHRAQFTDNDPTEVVLRFLAANSSELGVNPSGQNASTHWVEVSGDWVAPPSTHFVRIELRCSTLPTNLCNGHFDGVQLWAEWNG